MAGSRRSRKARQQDDIRIRAAGLTGLLIILAVAFFFFLNDNFLQISGVPTTTEILQTLGIIETPVTAADGEAAVHFIDVGQGDCELITVGNSTVLIDCGEQEYYENVRVYLDNLGIKKLDYVIATHPHSDHMGGMADILINYTIGHFLMPRTSDDMIPSTRAYESMLDAIETYGISASYAEVGDIIKLDNGGRIEILAPLHDDYDNLNNYSVTMRFSFGATRFLFTGDIERAAENDILNSGADISCNVIKIAHHGSTSSSTMAFLREASPQYAVINVGKDNSYGHPKQAVLDRLKEIGCKYYTTMQYGNIVFVSDGQTLTLHSSKGDIAA